MRTPRRPCRRCFNPHPARRPGATLLPAQSAHTVKVSILTRPEGRVLLDPVFVELILVEVSILTRPEGRVLRVGDTLLLHDAIGVSILTRPEGRVLPATLGRARCAC